MSSLESALHILRLLGPDRPVLRVGEVCRLLDMPKSSVSRLLRTLAASEMLDRAGDGGYRAGPACVRLATLYRARHAMREAVIAELDGLVQRFGFTGFVSVLSGSAIVLVHVRQGSHPLRYVRDEGTRLPAWQTAMGHVLLARLPDSAIDARLRDAGEIDFVRLRRDLAAVRNRGFILAGSVLTQGATTIAAAVTDPASGEPIALALAYADTAADAPCREAMTTAILNAVRDLEELSNGNRCTADVVR
jgi:DNA-binding IclR family transcriptional regulator